MVPLFDGGNDVGMVLSPQCFHNLRLHADVFNHANIHFWEYAQHGYDALGFISCTGQPLKTRVIVHGLSPCCKAALVCPMESRQAPICIWTQPISQCKLSVPVFHSSAAFSGPTPLLSAGESNPSRGMLILVLTDVLIILVLTGVF